MMIASYSGLRRGTRATAAVQPCWPPNASLQQSPAGELPHQALRSAFCGSYGESTSTVARLRSPSTSIDEFGADRGELRLHVTDRQALAQAVPVVARGGAADELAIGRENRLVAERVGIGDAVHFERDEAERHAVLLLLLERLAAGERALVHAHEAGQPGLERRVVARQVAAPHAVGLLHAQRLHRAHAGHADAVLGARRENRVEQAVRVLDREMQFPAERADEVHAQRVDVGREAGFDHLARQPGERRVVERHVGEFRHARRGRADRPARTRRASR